MEAGVADVPCGMQIRAPLTHDAEMMANANRPDEIAIVFLETGEG
jgi:hypothetical protein